MNNPNMSKKRKLPPATSPPLRALTENLHVHNSTLACAHSGCVACLYKILTPEISLDKAFTSVVQNCRPEMCPRCSSTSPPLSLFTRNDKVLTVGDGDLSFSQSLALNPNIDLTATVYEDLKTLNTVYGLEVVQSRMAELVSPTTVKFSVDATKLSSYFVSSRKNKFNKIVWNFPCTAEQKGQDGQNSQMDENKQMLQQFAEQCSEMMEEGEILVSHKTKPPYNQWDIVELMTTADTNSKIEYVGCFVFDKVNFPKYTNRKALDKKSFTMHDAVMYVFKCVGKGGRRGWLDMKWYTKWYMNGT